MQNVEEPTAPPTHRSQVVIALLSLGALLAVIATLFSLSWTFGLAALLDMECKFLTESDDPRCSVPVNWLHITEACALLSAFLFAAIVRNVRSYRRKV